MYRTIAVYTLVLLQFLASASAERIKRKPPTDIEAARLASDQAMSDGTLHVGDVIATDRGFFQFRGSRPDGSSDFTAVSNPLSSVTKGRFGNPP
jgi:hypothetical protein